MTGPRDYDVRKQLPPSCSKQKRKTTAKIKTVAGVKTIATEKRKPALKTKIKTKMNIIPCPFKLVERDEAALKAAQDLQLKLFERGGGLNSFGYVYSNGKGYHSWAILQGACYVSLRYGDKKLLLSDNNPVFFVDYACRHASWKERNDHRDLSKKDALAFAEWAANESLWAPAFYEKAPEKLLTYPTIYHTVFPLRFILQAAMMLRYTYEHPNVVNTWLEFSNYIDKDAAWILANRLDIHNGVFKPHNTIGHALFDSGMISDKILLHSVYHKNWQYCEDKAAELTPFNYNNLGKIWAPVLTTGYGEKGFDLIFPERKPVSSSWNSHKEPWKVQDAKNILNEILVLNGVVNA